MTVKSIVVRVGMVFASIPLLISPAQADASYSVQFAYSAGVSCNQNGFSIPDTITFNLPTNGAQFSEVDVLNGQPVYTQSGITAYFGSGTYNGRETASQEIPNGFPAKLPYTYFASYVFAVNNVPLNSTTLTLVCDSSGAAMVSITNGLPTTNSLVLL